MSAPSFRERFGPWALIAGAAEGLGAEYARQLGRRGLHLVLVDRHEQALQRLARGLRSREGVEVRLLVQDLGQTAATEVIASSTEDLEVGLLIYNAADSALGGFMNQPIERLQTALQVNCQGPLSLAHRLAQPMARRGRGGIILMGSLAGQQGTALFATYAATKAFNILLAEGLWDELRPHGVHVLACCPGATRTPGYLASRPNNLGRMLPPVMEPAHVVTAALTALDAGDGPVVIPGRMNRLVALLMQRLLPRRTTVSLMSRATRELYRRS